MSNLSQLTYELLFEFVEEMSPDYEMCVDFLESQDIGITDEVDSVISELLESWLGLSFFTHTTLI